jgi:sugar lactone lactonase YvrE
MMKSDLELVVDAHATLGEGPGWDQPRQCLYWVDIMGKRLHIYKPQEGTNRTIQLEEMIGCAVPRQAGGMILGLQNGFALLDLETEHLTHLMDPEPELPNNRFNDGKCDPLGRFLAGTMALSENEITGSLYLMERDFTVRRLFDSVAISNGIGWSPDYRTMYYIDSPTKVVVAFDYELETGHLSHRRVVVTIPKDKGFPDGMTTDEEGMLWIALWGGESVTRWDPISGELLARYPVPALNVSSCTFGGPERRDLYITTARKDTDAATLEKYPHTGGLFRLKTQVVGLENFAFAG